VSDETDAEAWRVPAALDGERVDRTVSLLTGLARSRAASLVAEGRVVVGRAPVRSPSRRVHEGERLRIEGDLSVEEARPDDLPDPAVSVPVVHADDAVIVVDKPAGLVVHPGAGHHRGTLVQGLAARYPELVDLARAAGDPDGAQRPGIVHRLDRGTSGLMVVARTAAARDALVAQLAARSVERRYLALAAGLVTADEGLIDAPLGRAAGDPTRRAVRVDGREARTGYQVAARYQTPAPATLLHCRLETGRTHQVRVHLAAIGHPLFGDARYGGPAFPGSSDGEGSLGPGRGGERPWLHAEALGFDHPVTGERLSWTSPLPDDLQAVLARFS
jgi:23S rRNA pseudouridine1911/1915/1917 synthase